MTGIARGVLVTLFGAWLAVSGGVSAQQPTTAPPPTGAPFDAAKVPAGLAPPKLWTAQQDHQDMMDRLGIKALRPGPSGSESAPNHANYNEALANPYPNLPDVLTLENGRKVTSAAMWTARRKEIVEEFDREVLGRVPKNAPKVTWTVTRTADATVGGHAVVGRALTGHVDNSAYPAIDVDILMTLVTPKDARGPVPVMMMFGGGRVLPGEPAPAGRGGAPGFGPPAGSDPPATEQLIADGWGYVSINPASIQADNGAGLTRGIIGLVNKGQPRTPEDWGALRAWAWGASRGLDYLETEKTVDAKKVGIEGVSRYGKAALVTMAYDTRFAVVLIGSSGEGGAKLHRRNFGEAVENLTGRGEYHWMAGSFLKYGAAEATFGSKNAGDIPVDAHELIALCAPRLTFVSYGVPEKGDAQWLDQQGSFMAAIAAQPVFRLLGARDFGRSDHYNTEKMPAVNVSLLDGHLAWRQHDGGHTDGPNWQYFIPWADTFLKHPPGQASGARPEPTLPGVGTAMQEMIAKNEIAGAVTMVVTGDKVLHLETSGFADVAAKRPMSPDTLFWIASMTKPVTGVAILMLQDEGKLSVADPVAQYLPEFAALKTPSGKPANLTLIQILTHTSGLGEAVGPAAQQARTLADLVPVWLAAPMQYEPGEKWKYTQSGINAAARIVEVVSGMTFDAFVQKRMFDPLGMKNTTFYPTDEQRARLATAYARNKDTGALESVPPRPEFGPRGRPPQGNGGLYSTAPDYARFSQMLLGGGTRDGHRYLSATAMKFLTTPQTAALPTGFFQNDIDGNHGANYGWGIATCILRVPHDGVAAMLSPGTYGHGGAWGTQAWIDPVKGVAYVLMVQRSNFPNSDASEVRRDFQQAAANALATK